MVRDSTRRTSARFLFGGAIPLCVTLVLVAFGILQYRYAIGGLYYYHDSAAAMTNMYLFYDRVLAGHSWLWTSALNGGQPLWPVTETMPVMDPLAMVIWAIAYHLGWNALIAYQLTCIAWLSVFAFGGYRCAQLTTQSDWAAVLVLALLLLGPIALSVPAQSYGFLIPFRYLPLCLFLYVKLIRAPSWRTALWLGCILALSWAGYQSAYLVIALSLFVAIHTVVVAMQPHAVKLLRTARRYFPASILLGVIGLLPFFAFMLQMKELVPIPRVYEAGIFYYIPYTKVIHDLFAPLGALAGLSPTVSTWHGSFDLGLFPVLFLLASIAAFASRTFSAIRTRQRSGPVVEAQGKQVTELQFIWFPFALAMVVLCAGGFGIRTSLEHGKTVLDIRNWGFLATPAVFGLIQMAGDGFAWYCSDRKFTKAELWLLVSIGSGAAAVGAYFFSPPLSLRPVLAALIGAAIGAVLAGARVLFERVEGLRDPRASLLVIATLYALTFALLHPSDYRETLQHAGYRGEGRIFDASAYYRRFLANIPRFHGRLSGFEERREWTMGVAKQFPLQLEAPEVEHRDVAYLKAQLPLGYSVSMPAVKITQQFRLKRYQDLITQYRPKSDKGLLQNILGVNANILRVVAGVVRVSDEKEALVSVGKLYDSGLLSSAAVVEGQMSGAGGLSQITGLGVDPVTVPHIRYSIRVEAFAPGKLRVAVHLSRPGLLVFADGYASGWRVTVDGNERPLLAADVTSKAVIVPAGNHVVAFSYEPWAYIIAFVLRAILYAGFSLALGWKATAAVCRWARAGFDVR